MYAYSFPTFVNVSDLTHLLKRLHLSRDAPFNLEDGVPPPTLDVKVTVSRALLSPQQIETGNLLTITVGGMSK